MKYGSGQCAWCWSLEPPSPGFLMRTPRGYPASRSLGGSPAVRGRHPERLERQRELPRQGPGRSAAVARLTGEREVDHDRGVAACRAGRPQAQEGLAGNQLVLLDERPVRDGQLPQHPGRAAVPTREPPPRRPPAPSVSRPPVGRSRAFRVRTGRGRPRRSRRERCWPSRPCGWSPWRCACRQPRSGSSRHCGGWWRAPCRSPAHHARPADSPGMDPRRLRPQCATADHACRLIGRHCGAWIEPRPFDKQGHAPSLLRRDPQRVRATAAPVEQ